MTPSVLWKKCLVLMAAKKMLPAESLWQGDTRASRKEIGQKKRVNFTNLMQ